MSTCRLYRLGEGRPRQLIDRQPPEPEWRSSRHVRTHVPTRRDADVWIGGARSRAHVRTVRECTRTDERPNVFYCSADTRIWRGREGRAIGKRAQQAIPIWLLITVSLVNAPLPPSPMGSKRCADVRPPRVSVYRICIFTRFFFFRNSVPRSFFFSLETRMREIDQIIFMAIL